MAQAVPVRVRPSAPSQLFNSPWRRVCPLNPRALDPQKSYAVFASAGTGKTWLLVARLLRLLLAGAQPETILAITFTRKAAAEIQQRLVERLQDWW